MDNLFNSNNSDQDDSFNFGKCLKLSFKHRLYCFIGTAVVSLAFFVLSGLLLTGLNFKVFGVTYSIANICLILSTLFLFGPIKQIKTIFSSLHQGISMLILILAIILTFVSAFALHSAILCIILIIIQIAAFIWYMIVSIPGGRTLCCTCIRSTTV